MNNSTLLDKLQKKHNIDGFYIKIENKNGKWKHIVNYSNSLLERIWIFIKSIFSNHYIRGQSLRKYKISKYCDFSFTPLASRIVRKGPFRKVHPAAIKKFNGEIPILATEGPFYHATKFEESLKEILLSRGVEVRHKGLYEGAFVSKVPEYNNYGNYVLVFYDTLRTHKDGTPRSQLKIIDRNTTQNSEGKVIDYKWIGFAKRLPVNDRYLAGIILHNSSESERKTLKSDLKDLKGRKIVVELSQNLNRLKPSVIAQNTPKI